MHCHRDSAVTVIPANYALGKWCVRGRSSSREYGRATAAAEVRGAQMSRAMVESLRDGYLNAVARGRGLGVAPLRVQILNNILENW